MNIILELDPVEFDDDVYNTNNEVDVGFLSLDSKIDWSVTTQECNQPASNEDQNMKEKEVNFKQEFTIRKVTDDASSINKGITNKDNGSIPKLVEKSIGRSVPDKISGKDEIYKKKKLIKNGSKTRRRRRKNITVRRDQYKKRKDVLLKSILRKFRKFYQDEYTNFTRLQFLESSSVNKSTDAFEIFPEELENQNNQDLTREALESFSKCPNFSIDGFGEVNFSFFGALISPRTFKEDLRDGRIPLDASSDKKIMMEN